MSHTISQVPLYKHIQTCKICDMYLCMAHWHVQTRHGNYRSHACGLRDSTSKHGNHDCGIAMYWQEAPSVETGVLLASGKGLRAGMGARFCFSQAVLSASTIPTTYQAHSICQSQRRKSHVKRRKGWSAHSSTSPSYTMVLYVTLFSFSLFLS